MQFYFDIFGFISCITNLRTVIGGKMNIYAYKVNGYAIIHHRC